MTAQITHEDFQTWRAETWFTYARRTGIGRPDKSIQVNTSGNIRVVVDGKTVYEGMQSHPAIQAFNEH